MTPLNSSLAGDARVRHNGLWMTSIYPLLGLQILFNKHQPCPACGGTDRFRADDKNGTGSYICGQCGAGDGYSLLMKVFDCNFGESVKLADDVLNNSLNEFKTRKTFSAPTKDPQLEWKSKRNLRLMLKTWTSGCQIDLIADSAPGVKYLRSRGLEVPQTSELRCSYDLVTFHNDTRHEGPGLIAAVRTLDGELRNVQRIFLTDDGKKAFGKNSKRFCSSPHTGSLNGCSVQIHRPGNDLLVGEGIETCLAGSEILSIPCWAGLSANGLAHIQLPNDVKTVVIAVDNDDEGMKSARVLSERLRAENKTVKFLFARDLMQNAPEHFDLADYWETR